MTGPVEVGESDREKKKETLSEKLKKVQGLNGPVIKKKCRADK